MSGTSAAGRAPFGERVAAAVADRGTLCVGIDPHPALLEAWGLGVDAAGVAEFSRRVIAACGDLVPAIKPQVAFFEEHGSAGFAVLEEVLGAVHAAGCLSIADAKRGDIGSTMAGYARAWLREGSPLACDAVTVSPYLGVGALDAAFDAAAETGRGLFVLARTSNPEAGGLQRSTAGPGEPPADPAGAGAGRAVTVAQSVVDEVGRRNAARRHGAGSFGVVVGATVPDPPDLDRLGGPVLMPGVGEQGGTPADVRRIAGRALPLTLVNVSRSVLRAGPDVDAMRAAVSGLVTELRIDDSPASS